MPSQPILGSTKFQSTLPCGSDPYPLQCCRGLVHFNPRSLAGATSSNIYAVEYDIISIHAPLRERPSPPYAIFTTLKISIHAPLRERHFALRSSLAFKAFQSTLPCGSDNIIFIYHNRLIISIHAPLRERRGELPMLKELLHFNPRSLAGATSEPRFMAFSAEVYFNPRSLAGATSAE